MQIRWLFFHKILPKSFQMQAYQIKQKTWFNILQNLSGATYNYGLNKSDCLLLYMTKNAKILINEYFYSSSSATQSSWFLGQI